MGVFSRFMDIVNANINAMLDKAEDPEKMIRMMLQEMEDTLIELKSSCAAKLARATKTGRLIDEQKALIQRWQARAALAVERGFDDLAREAIAEKRRAQQELDRLTEEQTRLDDLIKAAKADIVMLEDKLDSVKLKYQSILEKARREREKARADESARKADESETLRRFREMEEKIDRMNAENQMNGTGTTSRSTEERFRDLEEAEAVERELQNLRRQSEGEEK
ncbi:MAG: PspA/IM30 family protein [Spirochaetales bacterium]|nr:PspA/IM30 family protein [Spirochaetales bacterium]